MGGRRSRAGYALAKEGPCAMGATAGARLCSNPDAGRQAEAAQRWQAMQWPAACGALSCEPAPPWAAAIIAQAAGMVSAGTPATAVACSRAMRTAMPSAAHIRMGRSATISTRRRASARIHDTGRARKFNAAPIAHNPP